MTELIIVIVAIMFTLFIFINSCIKPLKKRIRALEQKTCKHDWVCYKEPFDITYKIIYYYHKKCATCGVKHNITSYDFNQYWEDVKINKLKQDIEDAGYKIIKTNNQQQ